MVNATIVPYTSSPPMIDMTIDVAWMMPECASSTGSAMHESVLAPYIAVTLQPHVLSTCILVLPTSRHDQEAIQLTYSHNDQERRQKPPKVHRRRARAIHEVRRVCIPAAYPVRQRRNHVRGDDG